MRFILKILNKYLYGIGILVLLIAIEYGSVIALIYISGGFLDVLVHIKHMSDVNTYVRNFLLLTLLFLLVKFCKTHVDTKVRFQISFDMSQSLARTISMAKDITRSGFDYGYLAARIRDDTEAVIQFLVGSLITSVLDLTKAFVLLAIIFRINKTAFCLMVSTLPLYLLIYAMCKRKLFIVILALTEKKSRYFSAYQRQFKELYFIKIHSIYNHAKKVVQNAFVNYLALAKRYALISYFISSWHKLINTLATLLLIYISADEIIAGRMSLGQFNIINVYCVELIGIAGLLLNLGKEYQSYLVALKRINELLLLAPEDQGQSDLSRIKTITLKNISFFDSDFRAVLKDFSYSFDVGKIYCITGANGAGKSTLLSIIAGLTTGYSGSVLYDDLDIRRLDTYSLRKKHLAVQEQNPVMYFNTIDEILTLHANHQSSNSNSNSRHLDYLRQLYDTESGDNLERILSLNDNWDDMSVDAILSAGEKKRIALARAFAKPDSSCLLLDEPTASIDLRTIDLIIRSILTHAKEKIVIIVSHEPKVMEVADYIISV